jgi:hypothetical protein
MKKFLKSKSPIVLAIKTFIQGFLASLCVTSINGLEGLKSALIGAIAGGISAIMNLIINKLDIEEE